MYKHDIAYIANLIGDPARSAILIALLEGRALTAGELAHQANISPQTASSHLSKLIEAHLITVEAQGRHRYYKLANTEVAHILEALAAISSKPSKNSLTKTPIELRFARTCYDHIAGKLGVVLTESLLNQNLIKLYDKTYKITNQGEKYFTGLGIKVEKLAQQRRRLAYPCLDWSERVSHLAGSLGAGLLNLFLEKRWILRAQQGRALYLTKEGKINLNSLFSITSFF